jgi:hypothetical protein
VRVALQAAKQLVTASSPPFSACGQQGAHSGGRPSIATQKERSLSQRGDDGVLRPETVALPRHRLLERDVDTLLSFPILSH